MRSRSAERPPGTPKVLTPSTTTHLRCLGPVWNRNPSRSMGCCPVFGLLHVALDTRLGPSLPFHPGSDRKDTWTTHVEIVGPSRDETCCDRVEMTPLRLTPDGALRRRGPAPLRRRKNRSLVGRSMTGSSYRPRPRNGSRGIRTSTVREWQRWACDVNRYLETDSERSW